MPELPDKFYRLHPPTAEELEKASSLFDKIDSPATSSPIEAMLLGIATEALEYTGYDVNPDSPTYRQWIGEVTEDTDDDD